MDINFCRPAPYNAPPISIIYAMASIRRLIDPCRASTLLKSCQRCQCSVAHRGANSAMDKRSMCHVAASLFVDDARTQITSSAPPYHRPFHYSRVLHDDQKNVSTTDDIRVADVDESDSDADATTESSQSQLGKSFTDIPGATNTKQKTLAIIYTCKVCNTRSAKQFTEHAYKHGVVLVRCPGCQNLHLIADRLGWFEDKGEDGEGWDVQKILEKAGENVKAVSGEDVLELTFDDVMGTKETKES